MHHRVAIAVAAVVSVAGCKGGDGARSAARRDAAAAIIPADAGAPGVGADLALGPDQDLPHDPAPAVLRAGRLAGGTRSTLLLTLRSTPPEAMVSVDGAPVGRTPTLWETELDGREHEFTFVLPGYAIDRQRFIPTSDGYVHPTLVKISATVDGGGVPPVPAPTADASVEAPPDERPPARGPARPGVAPSPDDAAPRAPREPIADAGPP